MFWKKRFELYSFLLGEISYEHLGKLKTQNLVETLKTNGKHIADIIELHRTRTILVQL